MKRILLKEFKIRISKSFTLNFLILLFSNFCNRMILSPVYSFFPTFRNKWILSLTIFCFRVFGLLSSFSCVWIDPTRCTKKKLSFSIPILIYNFSRRMRYRWNRHHSYIVNIEFLNNLVLKQTFFIFCIFAFIKYKGLPAGKDLSWPFVQVATRRQDLFDCVCNCRS